MAGKKLVLLWVYLVLVYFQGALPLDLVSGPVKPQEGRLEAYAEFQKPHNSPTQTALSEFIISILASKKIEEITFSNPTPIFTSP
ncbi:MAG: hypothetical protein NG740_00635 [Omnitrophica bacterium]|nr:hypothetical protein [Candidatus Omnitrophota bacterium]